MSYYDDGYAGGGLAQTYCTSFSTSPLLMIGAGALGFFISPGKWKWFSLLGGVALAAADMLICKKSL